ncbi:Putative AAA+ ATPase domain, ATPase, AAA-type, core [Septoria linicola]|uniref:AAA+ ATPase domain, ATPase, AAA-type, core n=1 Tax=Septoria linicola TaxID=215465 RepID=A0A9Q9B2G8_9PEZI|nr:Putative AAA+ ATPase domain, ATPase, AAA-type, core [Septoria linicola]
MAEEVAVKRKPPPPPGKKPLVVKAKELTQSPGVLPTISIDVAAPSISSVDEAVSDKTVIQEQADVEQDPSPDSATDNAQVPAEQNAEEKNSDECTASSIETTSIPKAAAQNSDIELHDPASADGPSGVDPSPAEVSLQSLQNQLAELQARIKSLEESPTTLLNQINQRVSALEEDTYDDSDSESGEIDDKETGPRPRKASYVLNVMSMSDWDKRVFSRTEPYAMIDVVVSSNFFNGSKDNSDNTPTTSAPLEDRFDSEKDHGEYIKFIQVNSVPLVHLFYHVTGGSISDTDKERLPQPMVIVAPFKSFTTFDPEFQQAVKMLEGTWGEKAQSDPRAQISIQKYEVPSEREIVDDNDNEGEDKSEDKAVEKIDNYDPDDLKYNSYEAYLGARAWNMCYNRFIKKRWEHFRSTRVSRIRYGDLCNFYQPGDDVYEPEGEQKVWRVTSVTGGRPVLRHLCYGPLDVDEKRVSAASSGEGAGSHASSNDWTTLYVEGYYLNFDGRLFGAVYKREEIKYYPGSKLIRHLKIYPLRLLHDPTELERCTKAGKIFFNKCLPALHHYDGRTLTKSSSGRELSVNGSNSRSQDVLSAVYVDLVKAYQYNPDWSFSFGADPYVGADDREINGGPTAFESLESGFRYMDDEDGDRALNVQNMSFCEDKAYRRYVQTDGWINEVSGGLVKERADFKSDDYKLLPNRLYGFVFQTRTWACFDVDDKHLKEVPRDDSAWGELALPTQYKETLESLVELHFANKQATASQGPTSIDYDFIQGKGAGLVVLLHGHPGVGKTSTAESIAVKYQKPLLPITCGNLGTDATSVEQHLSENFQLAQAWDAIVLLDEADVFLTRRNKSDLERNALVSVFLRTLEYYTGVLFLTTNRVGAFDGAFISRVHTSLYYPPLTLEQTNAIWKNNLRRLLRKENRAGNGLHIEGIGEELLEFAKSHYLQRRKLGSHRVWNGRQIRNSFQSAVALAQYEAKRSTLTYNKATLRASHFNVVARASAEFEEYLDVTREFTEDEILDRQGERAAEYTRPTSFSQTRAEQSDYQVWNSRELADSGHESAATATTNHPQYSTPRSMSGPNGHSLVSRPTFNSRIGQSVSPQPMKPAHQAPRQQHPSQAFTPQKQPSAAHNSGVPAGYTIIQTEQGPRLILQSATATAAAPSQQAPSAPPSSSFALEQHTDTYQHFDQQIVDNGTLQHEYGDAVIHTDRFRTPPPSHQQPYARSPAPSASYQSANVA